MTNLGWIGWLCIESGTGLYNMSLNLYSALELLNEASNFNEIITLESEAHLNVMVTGII